MSNKGKYVLAALAGAAIGGAIIAHTTRALPNLMSGMMAKCEQMMGRMKESSASAAGDGDASDVCKEMMVEKGQASKEASSESACHSQGGSCHDSD